MKHIGSTRSTHQALMRLARLKRVSELELNRHYTDDHGNREN